MDSLSVLGDNEISKLPFLPEAAGILTKTGYALTIDELVEEANRDILTLGIDRAKVDIAGDKVPSSDARSPELRILSFVVASIIVKLTESNLIMKRFALAEAKRVENYIKTMAKAQRDDAVALLTFLYDRVLRMRLYPANRIIGNQLFEFKLRFQDYLTLAATINAPSWRLVNQVLDSGYVYVKMENATRLARDAIARLIESHIRSLKIAQAPQPLIEEARKLVEGVSKGIGPVGTAEGEGMAMNIEEYPPCIRSLLTRLESGENLSHFARFLLATFLMNAGLSLDDIIRSFSRSPDFNERVTRYQLEHIAGKRGGGKRYLTPSCTKIMGMGLCARDDSCGNIKNPIAYIHRKRRREEKIRHDAKAKGRRRRKGVPEDEV